MDVYLSKLAESKLVALTNYLLEEMILKVKKDFLAKFDSKIKQISSHPESCPKSEEFGGFYKCVVTKQTTFFYRIRFDLKEIEVVTLFDTRQDPNVLKGQLE